jgi:cell division protein ZapD
MENTPEQITYEHPLNERTRTLLRFEHLFNKTGYHSQQETSWNSRAAIDGIVDMHNILLSRTDIKSEILKELGRYKLYFQGVGESPDVDQALLDKTLQQIETSTLEIQRNIGQIGHALRENDFIQSILNRSGIPGGNWSFDLSLYHHWLEQPAATRIANLQEWLDAIEPIRNSVMLLLSLMRDSSAPSEEIADHGMFQMSLNAKTPARLIRIGLPKNSGLLPKVSGSRHRFTIRFLKVDGNNKTTEINHDIQFLLTCCTI